MPVKLFFFLILLFHASLVWSGDYDWAKNVHEIKLPNGMKFLIYPRGSSPIFAASIRFRVGGIDEDENQLGIAHFLEHMAFKGTEKIGPRDFPRLIMENGGHDLNATTSKDETAYFVSLPSEKLRFWATLESERIFRPVFREFEQERDVILEERRMRIDNDPDGKLYEAFLGTAFQKSPYRWLTIGRSRDLLQLTAEDLKIFWKRHYHPSNAVGVLVGKINLEEAKTLLKETFGKVSFAAKPESKKYEPEPFQKEERRVEVSWKARPRLWSGYHKPSLPHPDDIYLDLVAELMANGRSSRLYKKLVLDRGLVSGISSSNGVPGIRLNNLFIFQADLLKGNQAEEVIRAIDEEIESFLRKPLPEAELKKVKNQIRISQLAHLETHSDLASELSYLEVTTGDWKTLLHYMERIEKASENDLKQAAKKYLIQSNRTVGLLRP